ncbi:MAG: hypothetical protein C0467_14605 [Planctomycetaceae bacterium]|nr:hypothetical protein [Planctomycetaceae bacterium]
MRRWFGVALLLVALTGCGNSAATPMRVWGTVTFAGEPVSDGTIAFVPIAPHTGPTTGGQILKGQYDVPAVVGPLSGGQYRVEITATRLSGRQVPNTIGFGGGMLNVPEMYIPTAYNAASKLQVTISPQAAENQFDFPLIASP